MLLVAKFLNEQGKGFFSSRADIEFVFIRAIKLSLGNLFLRISLRKKRNYSIGLL